tara:strand:- start:248 stop:544 length:297 start_codon:yes stop_codon:yes gene_type:complete
MARKKKAAFSICIEPTLNQGRFFSVTFSVGRVIKQQLVKSTNEKFVTDMHKEAKSVMTQPTWALKNMIVALEMCPTLNTQKETVRLWAAKLWLAHANA